MKDPASFGDPAHYDQRASFYSDYDEGGVHINSNILTHVQYKMYAAMPSHFTAQNIGKLWYSALSMLSPDSDFSDFRVILRQAAVNLGWGAAVLQVMDDCFTSSGIRGTAGTHTITFDKGDLSGLPPASITADYGDEFVIPECELTGGDVEFAAWSETGGIDDVEVYWSGKTYSMPAYDMVLKAVLRTAMWNGLTPSPIKGSGTEKEPYLIETARDLATLAYYINNYQFMEIPWELKGYPMCFKMTADIDLGNIPWIPIGLRDTSGISMFYDFLEFDGGGHVIKNLNITSAAYNPKRP